jgi:hypothetical protein
VSKVILSSKISLSSGSVYLLSIDRFTAKLAQSAPTSANTCVILTIHYTVILAARFLNPQRLRYFGTWSAHYSWFSFCIYCLNIRQHQTDLSSTEITEPKYVLASASVGTTESTLYLHKVLCDIAQNIFHIHTFLRMGSLWPWQFSRDNTWMYEEKSESKVPCFIATK